MDPSKGVIRWSRQRAHQHLQAVVTGAVAIPLAATIAGLFIALPRHPTIADRAVQAAEALGVGLLIVLALALGYAVLRAPYEQRRALRIEVLAIGSKYEQLVDEAHKSLVLAELKVQREVMAENVSLAARLNIDMRFRNDANIPIEYSMRELAFNIEGVQMQVTITPDVFYRIGPKTSDTYLFSVDLNPPLATGFDGTVEYVVWYGPTTAVDRYEQHYIYTVRNTLAVNQPATYVRSSRQAGGHDERRDLAEARARALQAAEDPGLSPA